MADAVEARVLYQDIETVQESASGRAAVSIGLGGEGNRPTPVRLKDSGYKPKPESDMMHDYGGNGPDEQVLAAEQTESMRHSRRYATIVQILIFPDPRLNCL